MSEIKCPYDSITLKLALLGLDKKLEDDELAKKINIRMSEFLVTDKSEINKKIAEYNGISVIDLINSPNYSLLREEFSKTLILKAIDVLKEESFSDKEAWALLSVATGNLKD